MHDAHFHYSPEIVKLQKAYHIPSLCSVKSEAEYRQARAAGLSCSAGVHPWDGDAGQVPAMMSLACDCGFAGEIGMDNVWCHVDPVLQRRVFEEQIAFAKEHHLPVILHTKGQEKEILDIIRRYPNTYVVHWYSCMELLKEYDEVAAYFTVGPSVEADPAVYAVASEIGMEKLLIESDGIDAIEWAIGCRDYIGTLQHTIACIAKMRGLSHEKAEQRLDANFARLMERRG